MDATLYRCRTPTDWLCSCGRAARALRRAGVSVTETRVPRRRAQRTAVIAASGQDRVPLLVWNATGEAICDSPRILEHLRWRASRDATRPAR